MKASFEYPCTDRLPEKVSLNICIAEHAIGINVLHDPQKVVKAGIKFSEPAWPQLMSFGPMRASLISSRDSFVAAKVPAIRHVKSVWPCICLLESR